MSKFKDLLLIINSIVLVGVLILVILLYKNSGNLLTVQNNQPQPSPKTTFKAEKGFLEYVNSFKKVRMEYPEGWQKKEYDNNVFVEFKKDDKWDFNIYQFAKTSNPSIDEYKKTVIDDISRNKGYKQVEEPTAATLAKLPAFKIIYMSTFDKTYKIMQIYTLKENFVYSITYRSSSQDFDAELPNIQKVIDSFTISD